MRRIIIAALLCLAGIVTALAQSSPGLVTGQVPTAAQWNSYFAAKLDVIGALTRAGGVMTGPLQMAPSTTSVTGIRLPEGAAPSSPVNGDLWTTTAGLFVRIEGVTVGPLASSSFGTPIASGSLLANSGASSAIPSGTTASAWFSRWCSGTQGNTPIATGASTWGCIATGTLSPLIYGAVCDGSTNDATAMQTAITAATNKILDLGNRTCRIDSTLTLPSGITLQNGTFDFSHASSSGTLLQTGGSDGTQQTIGAVTAGASTITVTNGAAFTVNAWALLKSTDASGLTGTKGEWAQIRSISTNVLTLYSYVQDSYATNVKISQPTMKDKITVRGMSMIGVGKSGTQVGALFSYLTNLTIDNTKWDGFGNRAVDVRRAIGINITNNSFSHANEATGDAYGVALVNGTLMSTVRGNTGTDIRHGVTVGGEDVVDRSASIVGNSFFGCTEACIDSHPGSWDITMDGNTINSSSTSSDVNAGKEGIVFQGFRGTITNNVITGFAGKGIIYQPETVYDNDSAVISGNKIMTDTSVEAYGIFVDIAKTSGTVNNLVISNNAVTTFGSTGLGILVQVETAQASSVSNISITGNAVSSRSYGLRVQAAANKVVQRITINGNTFESLDTTTESAIEILGSTAGAFLTEIIISNNITHGGKYGVSNTLGDRVLLKNNIFGGYGTANTNGTFIATSGESVFVANGTFTAPEGATVATVYFYEVMGAGGGGGGSSNANGAGSGGGAAGYCRGTFNSLPGLQTLNIAVASTGGTAGTSGGASGGAGSASAIGGPVSAQSNGGAGGVGVSGTGVASGGVGGSTTGCGTGSLTGASGADSLPAINMAGDGATSFFGGGGKRGQTGTSTGGTAVSFGAGGGGAYTAAAGGAGAPGYIRIWWTL